MTGPLAQLFAMLSQKQQGQGMAPDPRMRGAAEPSVWDDPSVFDRTPMDRTGLPPMPFRDPMQGGPEPPPRQILSAMYQGKR